MSEETCEACGVKGQVGLSFSKGAYNLARCAHCGFLFVHPFPAPEVLRAFYNDAYRDASADFYPKAESRWNRARIRALKFAPYILGRHVLDIGCGGGFMVEAFAKWSRSASGLDISEGAISYARAHFPHRQFYCESFSVFRERSLHFGFVFASELLEHLPGTGEFMATLRAVTTRGSLVYFSAPDAGHAAAPQDLSTWGEICPPEHLQFFDRASALVLFQRYGFRLHSYWRNSKPAHSTFFIRD